MRIEKISIANLKLELLVILKMEAGDGIEPSHAGFAVPRITTLLTGLKRKPFNK